jgi:hypothetical protein
MPSGRTLRKKHMPFEEYGKPTYVIANSYRKDF